MNVAERKRRYTWTVWPTEEQIEHRKWNWKTWDVKTWRRRRRNVGCTVICSVWLGESVEWSRLNTRNNEKWEFMCAREIYSYANYSPDCLHVIFTHSRTYWIVRSGSVCSNARLRSRIYWLVVIATQSRTQSEKKREEKRWPNEVLVVAFVWPFNATHTLLLFI